jgi:hypothetical protein
MQQRSNNEPLTELPLGIRKLSMFILLTPSKLILTILSILFLQVRQ